jgi:hypothetical protein
LSTFDGQIVKPLQTLPLDKWDDPAILMPFFLGVQSSGWLKDVGYAFQISQLHRVLQQSTSFWRETCGLPDTRMAFFWLGESDPFMHGTFYGLEDTFAASTTAPVLHQNLIVLPLLLLVDIMVEKVLARMGPNDHLILLSDHGIKNNVFHTRHGIWLHHFSGFQKTEVIEARMVDVAPTFLEILGLTSPPSMKGNKLWQRH